MKTLLVTIACLFSMSAFADTDDALVLVRGKVLSSTSFKTAHGDMVVVKVSLQQCGEETCDGQVKIALPAGSSAVKRNGQLVVVLTETALSKLEQFKSGGPMETMAMMAESMGGSAGGAR